MKLKEKFTAILFIAIFMISIFAVARAGSGQGLFPFGKYQYTTEEYYTGKTVDEAGEEVVVIPWRAENVEQIVQKIEDVQMGWLVVVVALLLVAVIRAHRT